MLHAENKQVRKLLLQGNFGLEKENMRVDANGHLAKTPHPFPDHAHIVRDFSEAQLEINTGVQPTPEAVVAELDEYNAEIQRALHARGAQESLRTRGAQKAQEARATGARLTAEASASTMCEYMWPSSNPPQLRGPDDIPIAQFTGALAHKTAYREHLAKHYGKYKMTFSGIHFNYSFSDELLRAGFEAEHTLNTPIADSSHDTYNTPAHATSPSSSTPSPTPVEPNANNSFSTPADAFTAYKNRIYLQLSLIHI